MPRWLLLALLTLPACGGGAQRELEAAEATLAAHRATMDALGAPRPVPRANAAPPPANLRPTQAAPFLGATPEIVRAALGEPMLRRAEGPAQVWLYSGGGCQLDIVFYMGEAGPRVAHIQARAGGITQRSEASCLRDISAQAAQPAPPQPAPPQPERPAPERKEAGSDA